MGQNNIYATNERESGTLFIKNTSHGNAFRHKNGIASIVTGVFLLMGGAKVADAQIGRQCTLQPGTTVVGSVVTVAPNGRTDRLDRKPYTDWDSKAGDIEAGFFPRPSHTNLYIQGSHVESMEVSAPYNNFVKIDTLNVGGNRELRANIDLAKARAHSGGRRLEVPIKVFPGATCASGIDTKTILNFSGPAAAPYDAAAADRRIEAKLDSIAQMGPDYFRAQQARDSTQDSRIGRVESAIEAIAETVRQYERQRTTPPPAPVNSLPAPVNPPPAPVNPLRSYAITGAGFRKDCICGDDAGLLNPAFDDDLFGPYAQIGLVKRLGNSQNIFKIGAEIGLVQGDRTRPDPIAQSSLSGGMWTAEISLLAFPKNIGVGLIASGEISGLTRTEEFQNATADFPGFEITRFDHNYSLGAALGSASKFAALSVGRGRLSNSEDQSIEFNLLRIEGSIDDQLKADRGKHPISAYVRVQRAKGNNSYIETSFSGGLAVGVIQNIALTASYAYSTVTGGIMPRTGEQRFNSSDYLQHIKECVAKIGVRLHWR